MKKAKRFRLTKAAKILIMFLIVALIGGGIFAGTQTGVIQMKKSKTVSNTTTTTETATKTESTSDSVNADKEDTVKQTETKKEEAKTADDTAINLSLDEWIG